jgi:hypothetical protein
MPVWLRATVPNCNRAICPRSAAAGSRACVYNPVDARCASATATLQVDAMSRALQSTGAIIDAAPAAVAKASVAIRQASFPELGAESTKDLLRGVGTLDGSSGAGESGASGADGGYRVPATAATIVARHTNSDFQSCASFPWILV